VDQSTLDDAGVFAFGRGEAWVQTVDFFTPVVDDPYDFGQIAAANSVSDVYAMGGTPLTALGILCFPDQDLPAEVMREILRGGEDKMREAGVSVIGGHSVRDRELKFGYSVTGVVKRRRILTNAGVRPGDHLLLTKPLGTGILATALKQGLLDSRALRRMTRTMATLNRGASEAAVEFRARSATDVTGFGLLGHAAQMAEASGVTLRLAVSKSWFMPRTLEFAARGVKPAGLDRNREFFASRVASEHLDDTMLDGLYDPQTSGGLLIAMPARRAESLRGALRRRRLWAVSAGEAIAKGKARIELRRA
jgi:selenide,water dikinase